MKFELRPYQTESIEIMKNTNKVGIAIMTGMFAGIGAGIGAIVKACRKEED